MRALDNSHPKSVNEHATAAAAVHWRDRPFVMVKIASELTGCSPASVYRFEKEGALVFRRLGGRVLVEVKTLAALVDTAEPWKPTGRTDKATAERLRRARAAWTE